MSPLRRDASAEQARALANHLQLAEDELRLAVARVGGLELRSAGKLVASIRMLQLMRLEISEASAKAGASR